MKINIQLKVLHMLLVKSFQDFMNGKSIPGYPRTVYSSLNIMC